jgi:Domain of unknown function (DUF4287)
MKTQQAHVPAMSEAAVREKTGRSWSSWFAALDKAGAAKLNHTQIAQYLSDEYGIPGWWCQAVTVEYELARGLRERHQKSDGYSVGISKTVATSLAKLYEATASPAKRSKWFPKGAFEPSSQTKNKYVRGAWNETGRIEIGFYAKGENKAQIAIQVNRLAKKAEVESQRALWKAAVAKLDAMLSG